MNFACECFSVWDSFVSDSEEVASTDSVSSLFVEFELSNSSEIIFNWKNMFGVSSICPIVPNPSPSPDIVVPSTK